MVMRSKTHRINLWAKLQMKDWGFEFSGVKVSVASQIGFARKFARVFASWRSLSNLPWSVTGLPVGSLSVN